MPNSTNPIVASPMMPVPIRSAIPSDIRMTVLRPGRLRRLTSSELRLPSVLSTNVRSMSRCPGEAILHTQEAVGRHRHVIDQDHQRVDIDAGPRDDILVTNTPCIQATETRGPVDERHVPQLHHLAVLTNLEVVCRECADGTAIGVDDDRVELHQFGSRAEHDGGVIVA